jgi:mono/diheme cytochrome c family protein
VIATRLRQVLLVTLAVLALGTVLSWDLISDAVRPRRPPETTLESASPPAAVLPAAAPLPHDLVEHGKRVFDAQCAACHGPRGDWPIAARLKGRTHGEFYALLDHLPAVNPVMPGFQGGDGERQALAAYLASLR